MCDSVHELSVQLCLGFFTRRLLKLRSGNVSGSSQNSDGDEGEPGGWALQIQQLRAEL